MNGTDLNGNPLAGDNTWRGPISLNTSTTIDVRDGTRLSLFGTIDDAANASAGAVRH